MKKSQSNRYLLFLAAIVFCTLGIFCGKLLRHSQSNSPNNYIASNEDWESYCQLVDHWDNVRFVTSNRFVVSRNDKMHLVNGAGDLLSHQPYVHIFEMCEGRMCVSTDLGWGYIDVDGKEIVAPVWDLCQLYFSEGCAWIEKDEKYGFVNINGEVISDIQWDWVREFSNGYAFVSLDCSKKQKDSWSKFAVIDQNGAVVIGPTDSYKPYLFEVTDDTIVVYTEHEEWRKKYAYLSTNGTFLTNFDYVYAGEFKNGIAWAYKEEGEAFVVFRDGTVIKPDESESAKYGLLYESKDGYAIIRDEYEDNYRIIDMKGREVFGEYYDDILNYGNGIFRVEKDGLYGIINANTRKKSNVCFDDILEKYNFQDDYTLGMILETDANEVIAKRRYYIDNEGNIIDECRLMSDADNLLFG